MNSRCVYFSLHLALLPLLLPISAAAGVEQRPNILIAISDDQSFAHTSAAGYRAINTPAFDRVAREGVLFSTAICSSPGCSPSRASLLTGRYPWQLEHAGTHASEFPKKFQVYPDLLEQAGYFVGFTGKGWGPGNWQVSGRARNPAGSQYSQRKLDRRPATGCSDNDYAANFRDFLADRPQNRPICFWYGAFEPHRGFEKGSGARLGKDLNDADVPPFLPDMREVRDDLLDYCLEIEHFDTHLGRMLDLLEKNGELENTIVVVTSDNGMSFPRAKANCYEFGIHVPLAIAWPRRVPPDRVVDDPVSFVDLAPTFLAAAGVKPAPEIVGKSLLALLTSTKQGTVEPSREMVFSARERHSSSRWNNLGYPQRAIRTRQYLFVRNFCPDRWPAGAPQEINPDGTLGPLHGAYHDIDACPTLSLLVARRDDPQISRFFHLSVDKRPAEELFDIQQDPSCLNDLASDPKHADIKQQLHDKLDAYLRETHDPRILDGGDIFETYRRYSPLREFPPPDAPLHD